MLPLLLLLVSSLISLSMSSNSLQARKIKSNNKKKAVNREKRKLNHPNPKPNMRVQSTFSAKGESPASISIQHGHEGKTWKFGRTESKTP